MYFRPGKMIFKILALFPNHALRIDLPANSRLLFLVAFARCGLFCVLSSAKFASVGLSGRVFGAHW